MTLTSARHGAAITISAASIVRVLPAPADLAHDSANAVITTKHGYEFLVTETAPQVARMMEGEK